jgi:hypothetical protein
MKRWRKTKAIGRGGVFWTPIAHSDAFDDVIVHLDHPVLFRVDTATRPILFLSTIHNILLECKTWGFRGIEIPKTLFTLHFSTYLPLHKGKKRGKIGRNGGGGRCLPHFFREKITQNGVQYLEWEEKEQVHCTKWGLAFVFFKWKPSLLL